MWAEGIQAAGGAALLCDNMGFMWAYKNGSSREEHVWTIAKCLCSISQGLGVPIKGFHTRRRTDLGDKLADDLSKNKLESTGQHKIKQCHHITKEDIIPHPSNQDTRKANTPK